MLGRRAAVSIDEVQCDLVRILDLVLETMGSTRDFADSALRLLPGWWFATFPLPLRPSQRQGEGDAGERRQIAPPLDTRATAGGSGSELLSLERCTKGCLSNSWSF